MKKVIIEAREFSELSEDEKKRLEDEQINGIVELEIDSLWDMLETGEITEEKLFQELGCSKYYAESTSWFVPSCYFDKHRDEILAQVKETLESWLYDSTGSPIFNYAISPNEIS
jgi:hypothetical protein